MRNEAAIAEFEGSMIATGESRPVMSRPPMSKAAKKVVYGTVYARNARAWIRTTRNEGEDEDDDHE